MVFLAKFIIIAGEIWFVSLWENEIPFVVETWFFDKKHSREVTFDVFCGCCSVLISDFCPSVRCCPRPQEKDNQRSRGLQGMVREFERLAFLGLNGWVVNVGEILKLNMGLPWVCLRCIFPMGDPPFGESIGFNMVWAIYTDLTGTETWNHGQWDGSSQKWPYFWLVNYCNLPRHGV